MVSLYKLNHWSGCVHAVETLSCSQMLSNVLRLLVSYTTILLLTRTSCPRSSIWCVYTNTWTALAPAGPSNPLIRDMRGHKIFFHLIWLRGSADACWTKRSCLCCFNERLRMTLYRHLLPLYWLINHNKKSCKSIWDLFFFHSIIIIFFHQSPMKI